MINTLRLFQLNNSNSRWGLLIHGGFQLGTLSPDMGTNQGKTEMNAGMLVGLTPQFRIGQIFSLFYDVVAQANVSQHYNWDGSSALYNENTTATLFSNAIGLSISLGKNKIHGDFVNVPNPNNKELNDLNERVAMMETFRKTQTKTVYQIIWMKKKIPYLAQWLIPNEECWTKTITIFLIMLRAILTINLLLVYTPMLAQTQ